MENIDISDSTTEIDTPADEVTGSEAWAMVESSPDGMLLADEDGRLVLVNSQIEKLFGYRRDQLLGRSVEILLPDRFQKAHTAHRTRYRVKPTPRAMGGDLDLRARRADGSEFPVEVSLSPIHTSAGTRVVATVRDVTERHEAEAETHAVLHTVNSTRDGVFMFDPESLQFSYVNQGGARQLGYSSAELLAMTPLHIKPFFDESSFRELLKPLLNEEVSSHEFTTIHRRKDGTDIPVEIVLEYPAAATSGRQRRLVAVVRDISERVSAELAVTASQEALRTAFEAAPVGMALADFADPVRRPITRTNAALCELLGYSDTELLTMGFAELTFPDDGPESDQLARQAVDGQISRYATEKRYLHADGHPIWVWVHSAVLDDGAGTPTSVLVHVADLTETKQAQRDEARVRLLEERERLAEDLHDLIIQRLFAAGMGLQSLQTHVTDPIAVDRLARTVDELDHAIADLRNAIFRLHSPISSSTRHRLEEAVHGANPALGFSAALTIQGDPEQIAGAVIEQLVPVITEALMNVSKHASARSASVRVEIGSDIILTVSDDGCGMRAHPTGGHGIDNMVARAERVGGTATVTSPPEGGTVVSWTARNR